MRDDQQTGEGFTRPMKDRGLHSAGVIGRSLFLALGLLLPNAAVGQVMVSSSVSSVVTPVPGGFQYDYTITNTSSVPDGPGLITWAMPFFDDAATSFTAGESSILAPDGWFPLFTPVDPATPDDGLWDYVAADDPKNNTYGAPGSAFNLAPYALVFFSVEPVPAGDSLGGFGYTSPFTGTNVPFIAGFDNLQLTIGDPVAPQTPSFPAAQSIPEPSSAVLLLGGFIAFGCISRWRKRRAAEGMHLADL